MSNSIIILPLFIFSLSLLPATFSSNETDLLSLLAFKSAIVLDPFGSLSSWNETLHFCRWNGIICGINTPNRVVQIDLAYQGLVGSLSPHVANLSLLRTLILQINTFRGPIPQEISVLKWLQIFDVRENSFTGEIPKNLSACPKLDVMHLSENHLLGNIPPDLGSMPRIRILNLGKNNLSGRIPPSIGNLTSLEGLYLESSGLEGQIPESLGKLRSLTDLHLRNNRFTGHIPKGIGRLNKLSVLDMVGNQLDGSLPTEIGNMTYLYTLYLSNNGLSGVLPPTIGNSPFLSSLDLHSNKLSGVIPSSICNSTSLYFLHLSSNTLEGSIPQCLGNLNNSLQVLHLKKNLLHGLIPSFTEGCVLKSLNLNTNQFGGLLPRSLSYCQQLEVLDVGHNEIRDTFPLWIETLLELRVLVLRSNTFKGTIVFSSESNTDETFPKLQVFDIAQNEFTSTLPRLSKFRAMINANESMIDQDWSGIYDETMTFVFKGLEISVVRILRTFTTIDISENRFYGDIPESIGNLNSLRYLNLSHNDFIGDIPSCFGNMSLLESMDLSLNQLHGEIPKQLTSLTYLAKLNLSMNNLVGRIPQSHQFNTFDNDSYIGNQGLCGFPLTIQCESLPSPQEEADDDDDDDFFFDGFTWEIVVLGYGCGFVFGVISGYFVFRYRRPKWLVRFIALLFG